MPLFNNAERYALLRLMSVPGIGSQRIRNLVARFSLPSIIFGISVRELVEVEGIDKVLARHIKNDSNGNFADTQMRLVDKCRARIVTFWDPEYPSLLKKIFDPPILLFVRGSLQRNDDLGLAIVGTRNPSSYGKLIAEKFAREMAQKGVTIVSGLARGIDTIAHRSALHNGGRTIGVLGSGVDVVYPEENEKLATEMSQNGAILSEFPMGTKPDGPHFPRRNRIIAGICPATLVVEAGQKSGAMITADLANDQGREIFAIPGNINNPKSYGSNQLIRQGATLVQSVEDILAEIKLGPLSHETEYKPAIALSGMEERLYSLLSHEPLHIDLIAKKAELPTSQALAILLTLELKNLVRQMVGKNFVRA